MVIPNGGGGGGTTTSETTQTATPQPCWEQLTCNRDDIARMSIDDRKRMIQWIDDHDGDRDAYLNAIRACSTSPGTRSSSMPADRGRKLVLQHRRRHP